MATVILAIMLLCILLQGRLIAAEAKALLFESALLDLVPVKVLPMITTAPTRQTVTVAFEETAPGGEAGQPQVVADLVTPVTPGPHPAILIAIAVLDNDQSMAVFVDFLDTLGRLGYMVLWPRQVALERGDVTIDDAQTYVRGIQYLVARPEVDPNRIAIIGFSAGASLALVAAEDPAINDRVQSVVFFGGYYQIESFLTSVASGTAVAEGRAQPWQPQEWVVWFSGQMLEQEGLTLDEFRDRPAGQREPRLDRLSPDRRIDQFQARMFIVHDRSDDTVPYTESLALRDALADRVPVTFLLSDMFEHVTVGTTHERSVVKLVRDVFALHDFLVQVFLAL